MKAIDPKQCDDVDAEISEQCLGWSTWRSVRTENRLFRVGQFIYEFLSRHMNDDWGNISPEAGAKNMAALKAGDGIVYSSYPTKVGVELRIITNVGHQRTEVFLEDEEQ